jgi:hypothetical protein
VWKRRFLQDWETSRHNFRKNQFMVGHNGQMNEATRQTLRRRSDEPKLEIGDSVPIKDGVVGIVVARFAPSGERRNEVHYVVELKADVTTVISAER